MFVNVSYNENFLEIINFWIDKYKIEMFDKLNVDDVTSIKNSICENDSNNNEFEFVKFKKTKSFKKIK